MIKQVIITVFVTIYLPKNYSLIISLTDSVMMYFHKQTVAAIVFSYKKIISLFLLLE